MAKFDDNKKSIALYLFVFSNFMVNIPIAFLQCSRVINMFYNFLPFIFLFFAVLNYKKIDKVIICEILYFVIYIFSTLIHENYGIHILLLNMVRTMNILLISKYAIEKKPKIFIKGAKHFFEVCILIEFVSIILFPHGLYYVAGNVNPHYFLGHRNNTIEYILPSLFFVYADDILNNKKSILSLLMVLICIACVFLTWSANSIVAIVLTFVYLLDREKGVIQKKFNFCKLFFMSVGLFFSFIVIKIQNLFEWFITGILHKSLTFTGRVIIWDKSLEYIKKSPIIGYGYESMEVKSSKIIHSSSSHNYFLDFLYCGGVLMLSDILAIIYFVSKKLNKEYKNNILNILKNVLIGIFAGYFIIWFATPIHIQSIQNLFLMFLISYNLVLFVQSDERV